MTHPYAPGSWGAVFSALIHEQEQEDACSDSASPAAGDAHSTERPATDLRLIPNAFANCPDEAAVEDLIWTLTQEQTL